MVMPGRAFFAGNAYRYGFNGKEESDEISEGAISFEARIYDTRIGRFFSTDPREAEYAWQSTYVYFKDCPISILDFNGMGEGDDDKPKAGSKGKVNVSFYSADTKVVSGKGKKRQHMDGQGVDKDKNGHDDFLEVSKKANISANNATTFKTYGIDKLEEIKTTLDKLQEDGFEIGNVIINAHSNPNGWFYLGGKHGVVDLIDLLKGNVSSSSNVIINSCNIGAGYFPENAKSYLNSLAKGIGCNVFASLSFGIGSMNMFSGNVNLSSSLPAYEYGKEGNKEAGHSTYPDNTILYAHCYLFCRPYTRLKPLTFWDIYSFTIVTSVRINCDGDISYNSNVKNQLDFNKKELDKAVTQFGRPSKSKNSGELLENIGIK